ncbi:MAG: hypothetical protein F4Y04_05760 [Chloroflexi bacterium]|nr:hypothetical protein [Chloroflexota bacterium]
MTGQGPGRDAPDGVNAEAIRQFYVAMNDEDLHAHLLAAGIEHMNRRGSADGIGGLEFGMRTVRQLWRQMEGER